MSPKETAAAAAMTQLLSLLEARYALRVLWALRDGRGQTFRLLQDSVGGVTPNTLNTRLKELRAAGWVQHDPQQGYGLSTQGTELVKRLGDMAPFAQRWAVQQNKKK